MQPAYWCVGGPVFADSHGVTVDALAALLHLHRSYFTLALTGSEDFTVQHIYAPSVLAVYSGCCSVISTIHTLYTWEPELSIRYSIFWANCFSAAVNTGFWCGMVHWLASLTQTCSAHCAS